MRPPFNLQETRDLHLNACELAVWIVGLSKISHRVEHGAFSEDYVGHDGRVLASVRSTIVRRGESYVYDFDTKMRIHPSVLEGVDLG